MTPREFDALLKRYHRQLEMQNAIQERADLRAGIIAATIANFSMSRKRGKVYKPKDFMPRTRQRKTWKQMLRMVELLNAAFGGKDMRKK